MDTCHLFRADAAWFAGIAARYGQVLLGRAGNAAADGRTKAAAKRKGITTSRQTNRTQSGKSPTIAPCRFLGQPKKLIKLIGNQKGVKQSIIITIQKF